MERHLGLLELGIPRESGPVQLVPLKRSGGESTPRVRDWPWAVSVGQIDLQSSGSIVNRGSQPVLGLEGDRLSLGQRERYLRRPFIIPPGRWPLARLAHALRDNNEGWNLGVGSPLLPERRLDGIDDLTSEDGNRVGAVLLQGRSQGCAAISPSSELCDHALRMRLGTWPHEEENPPANPLKSIRRFFLRSRYAETTLLEEHGGYSLYRIAAPLVEGWLATEGESLLYMELEATPEAFRRAPRVHLDPEHSERQLNAS